MSYLGDKLKQSQMTQTELANRCGTTKQNISCYVNGKYKRMPLDLAHNISLVLNITLEELLEGIKK